MHYLLLLFQLSLMDWWSDLWATKEYVFEGTCTERVFGLMMGITVFLTPIAFSFVQPSADELLLWEKIIRACLRHPQPSPYERWTIPDPIIWYPTKFFYHLMAPFTHVISQVKVHSENAEKVDYYMEYDTRKMSIILKLRISVQYYLLSDLELT